MTTYITYTIFVEAYSNLPIPQALTDVVYPHFNECQVQRSNNTDSLCHALTFFLISRHTEEIIAIRQAVRITVHLIHYITRNTSTWLQANSLNSDPLGNVVYITNSMWTPKSRCLGRRYCKQVQMSHSMGHTTVESSVICPCHLCYYCKIEASRCNISSTTKW